MGGRFVVCQGLLAGSVSSLTGFLSSESDPGRSLSVISGEVTTLGGENSLAGIVD